MIHTTIEQSKILLELGLEKESADLSYCALICDSRSNIIEKPNYTLCLKENEAQPTLGFEKYDIIPVWSFSKLLEIYIGLSGKGVTIRDTDSAIDSLIEKLIPLMLERGK